MYMFRSQTADGVWRLAYKAISTPGEKILVQKSRTGDTKELLHVLLVVEDPRQRWVLSRSPVINPAFAIAEVIWILAGSNEASVLNYWFPRLPEFAGEGPIYDGAYGHRLRHHFGVDQIKRACDVLMANPESRQVVLQLWDVLTDLPSEDGRPRSPDVPCNLMSMMKVRNGRLEWTQIMRSNDLFRGLPYNIIQFTVLQEVLAGWLHVDVGAYNHWSDSLHVYISDVSSFSCTSDTISTSHADSLAVDATRGDELIRELFDRMSRLTNRELRETELAELDAFASAPTGYKNLLHVLSAESARRRGYYDLADTLMADCTSHALVQAWSSWQERMRTRIIGSEPNSAPSVTEP